MAKQNTITDDMNVALATLQQALRMAGRMEDIGQIKKVLAEAVEQAEVLRDGLTAIREHVGKI